MDIRDGLVSGLIAFAQNTFGIVFRPYETYRRIIRNENIWEMPFIAVILALYFAIASIVKTAAFRPFLLTKQFLVLGSATGLTYLISIIILYKVARFVGGNGTLRKIAVGWVYTLIPTLLWFLTTSILYVVIPPPRTTSLAGLAFSAIFLVFSITLFLWKIILTYLTLRFGMRLTLPKILIVLVVTIPAMALYSFGMYRLGIFRIPFI